LLAAHTRVWVLRWRCQSTTLSFSWQLGFKLRNQFFRLCLYAQWRFLMLLKRACFTD
jgi:hypothetical protein